MPLPARYDGGADDSERLKVALGKESNWQLSWNELRPAGGLSSAFCRYIR